MTPPYLDTIVDKNSILIFDEYMQGLLDGRISVDVEGKLTGIFGLHNYCNQVFLFSGEHSVTLEKAIKRLAPGADVSMQSEWTSMKDFIGEGSTQDVKVLAYAGEEKRDEAFIMFMCKAE